VCGEYYVLIEYSYAYGIKGKERFECEADLTSELINFSRTNRE
jgi:hypothetical protein